jgi:hypothetical protein
MKNITNKLSYYESNKSIWAILIYFILCLYYLGAILMVHFVDYAALSKVQENIKPVMDIFNNEMTKVYYLPAGLLLISTISLYWLSPKNFPRWAIFASIILTIISVGTTLFVIAPIHSNLPVTGLIETVKQNLLPISLYFQIVPATLQVILVLFLLNIYLKDTKIFSRLIFILFFVLLFYSLGPGLVEGANYAFWGAVGEKDWLSFRNSGNPEDFWGLFLIPSVLPMFLSILLFWWRPNGFPKFFIVIFLLTQIEITIATATYFVPKIQSPLFKAFSASLIEDLNKYNFIGRGIMFDIGLIIIALSFIKIGQSIGHQQTR